MALAYYDDDGAGFADPRGETARFQAPEGFQWVLAPQRHYPPRREELVEFDNTSVEAVYQYKRLSNMRKRIRLLRLLPGPKHSDPTCELFEAEISPTDGKIYRVVSGRTVNERVRYEALSWSWGTDKADKRILIRQENGHAKMKASPALVWALKYLMYPSRDRILWVDAICIDQYSVEEKNHQVQMMSQIYSYAERVCVWLGRETDYSRTAINFIKDEVLKLHQFDQLCSNKVNAEKWQSLLRLMQRPWFFRRWVVQEIALARDAEIYCGPDRLAWKDFSVAVELFVEVETATHRLSEVMQKDPRFYHVPGWFEYVSALGASLLVEATGMVFRTYDRPNEDASDPIALRRPLLSLEYLVSKLSIFRASEPRDAIYALLAIANDGYPAANATHETESLTLIAEALTDLADQKPFPVDYGNAYNDVCQNFIEFCVDRSLDRSRALDILCRPWAPEITTNAPIHQTNDTAPPDVVRRKKELEEHRRIREERKRKGHFDPWPLIEKHFPLRKRGRDDPVPSLPSWIPKDTGAPYEMYRQPGIQEIMKLGRKNADPLVASPGHSRNYDAAQGMEICLDDFRFRKRRQQDAHSMFARGFVLTEVKDTTDASQSGNIPEEWFKLAGWTPTAKHSGDDIEDPPEAFWRTLVADRGKDGRNPPYYYSRACKESVKKGGYASGAVNTSDLINNERNSIVAQFCRRVQAVVWNRQLIKTELGNLGIARKAVRKGDLICIIYGCSVPVVLRRHKKDRQTIADEKEEDKTFPGLEKFAQDKYIRRVIRTAKLKKKWKNRPDTLDTANSSDAYYGAFQPSGSEPRWTFSKADVRKDIEEWKRRYSHESKEKAEHEPRPPASRPETPKSKKEELPQKTASAAAGAKLGEVDPFYYEFLGECYVHGMMDGEAIRLKAEHGKDRRPSTGGPRLAGVVRSVTMVGPRRLPPSPPPLIRPPRPATLSEVSTRQQLQEPTPRRFGDLAVGRNDIGSLDELEAIRGRASTPSLGFQPLFIHSRDSSVSGHPRHNLDDAAEAKNADLPALGRQASKAGDITPDSDDDADGQAAREGKAGLGTDASTTQEVPSLQDLVFELR